MSRRGGSVPTATRQGMWPSTGDGGLGGGQVVHGRSLILQPGPGRAWARAGRSVGQRAAAQKAARAGISSCRADEAMQERVPALPTNPGNGGGPHGYAGRPAAGPQPPACICTQVGSSYHCAGKDC